MFKKISFTALIIYSLLTVGGQAITDEVKVTDGPVVSIQADDYPDQH